MKASGKRGSNGEQVSDNVEKRLKPIHIYILYVRIKAISMYKVKGFAKANRMSVI